MYSACSTSSRPVSCVVVVLPTIKTRGCGASHRNQSASVDTTTAVPIAIVIHFNRVVMTTRPNPVSPYEVDDLADGPRQGLLAARGIAGQWSPLARGADGPSSRNRKTFATPKTGWVFSCRKAHRPAGCAQPHDISECMPAMA